jgi:hypothetical protein
MDGGQPAGRIQQLARMLLDAPDAAACERCLDALDDYVAAQLAGDDYGERFSEVAVHLDSCVACAEGYALLYEARLGDAALDETHAPAPDLSFLEPGVAEPLAPDALRARRARARQADAIAAASVRVGNRLRLTLSAALLALLPPPAPTPALRGAAATPFFELAANEPDAAVERLVLTAYLADTPNTCLLRVQLALRGRALLDLGGVAIVLLLGDERRTATTDAWGEAVFADVPRAALATAVLEVLVDPTT